MQDDDKLLSTQEVADYLGVTIHTLCVYRITGNGPKYLKIGRTIRYRVSDVRNWVTRSLK